jgi:hexosaminidase
MFALFALAAVPSRAVNPPLSIIPEPNNLQFAEGRFRLGRETRIAITPETEEVGQIMRDELHPGTGLPLEISGKGEISRKGGSNAIILRIDHRLADQNPEGYTLDVRPDRVEIVAPGPAGVFYGVQTLRQLLPARTLRESPIPGAPLDVPCLHIEDKPRFPWRGAMLDVSRHFEPKAFLLKFIDLLAFHKMNTFHLHLTDDQGWRIEIKKYPRLTEFGAWHKANGLTDDPTTWKSMPDGGFYTQDDLREVVAYAKARFVNIVPEIEMPGHSAAAIASYPELGNTGKSTNVPGVNEGAPNVLNASERTVRVYQDILSEVIAIFPSKFIHIGGDEVGKGPWHDNPEMQSQMKSLGLKSEDELQSWFVSQMDRFLSAHSRRLVGWDEILEGGLAPGATVMSWRGIDGGIAAARANHDVVMAPGHFTYLDHYQSTDHSHEPVAIGDYLPLDRIYGYEPIPSALTPAEAKHVLGGQCQLWTEYIPNAAHVEYMAYPRICAMAEVDWSRKEERNYDDFLARLGPHLERLHALDVHYRPLDPPNAAKPIGFWRPDEITEKYAVHSWAAPMQGPGEYEATFEYTDGACRLDIAWVELAKEDRVLARDEHYGRTGGDNANNVYRLAVRNGVTDKACVLRASVRTDGGTDSAGEIRLVKVR